MGFFLWIVSKVVTHLLWYPHLMHLIIGAFRHKGGWKYVDNSFLNSAYAEDVYANISYSTMLNDLFIQHGGYHYGKRSETISSATGKNYVLDKLAFLGKCLAGGLNLIDFKNWKNGGHCWVSMQGDRTLFEQIGRPKPIPWYYTVCFFIITSAMLYSLWKLAFWLISVLHTLYIFVFL